VRELVKSFFSLGIASSLFSLKQIENMLTPGQPESLTRNSVDSVTKAVMDQFGGSLRATFSVLDNIQRGVVTLGFVVLGSSSANTFQRVERTEHHKGAELARTSRRRPRILTDNRQDPSKAEILSGRLR
jgi:hypothetical protein